MSGKEFLKQALNLKSHEKILIIEGLYESLDHPDIHIDEIWALEAEKRLEAYREGRLKVIPAEEIFTEENK